MKVLFQLNSELLRFDDFVFRAENPLRESIDYNLNIMELKSLCKYFKKNSIEGMEFGSFLHWVSPVDEETYWKIQKASEKNYELHIPGIFDDIRECNLDDVKQLFEIHRNALDCIERRKPGICQNFVIGRIPVFDAAGQYYSMSVELENEVRDDNQLRISITLRKEGNGSILTWWIDDIIKSLLGKINRLLLGKIISLNESELLFASEWIELRKTKTEILDIYQFSGLSINLKGIAGEITEILIGEYSIPVLEKLLSFAYEMKEKIPPNFIDERRKTWECYKELSWKGTI